MKGENNHNYNSLDYTCDGCKVVFKINPYRKENNGYNFCSYECYKENIGKYFKGERSANYNHKEYTCDWCQEKFKRTLSQVGKNKYCSHVCALRHISFKSRVTKVQTECSYCKAPIKVMPLKLKTTTRVYCSTRCKDKGWGKYYSGENNPQWDSTITKEERIIGRRYPEYGRWRKGVYEKDGYKCQCCGDSKGTNLNAHHIFNYTEHPDLRIDIENGITLCEHCHTKFHKTYGYTSNNKEQIDMFIKQYQVIQASL